jgi:arsenite-transporting ATPase
VVVNRVLPDDLEGDFYKSRRKQEQIYVDEIRQRFSGYPLAWVPQLATDVYGLDTLGRVSSLLLRESESPK